MAAGAAAAPAAGAPSAPFGHACAPRANVLHCPTADLSQRVPSWDGVPLDVDVTLPGAGDGPFPAIVMLHGYGATKTSFSVDDPEAGRGYNNLAFARAGYAVVVYTARGWGESCGTQASRGAGCERGWIHSADARYEVRDTQHLLGLLVDQGLVRPEAIGVTGVSYGGGQSLLLAYLDDLTMLPDGRLVSWTSPAGAQLGIAAAWPRWGWSDLLYALVPNGRFRERDARTIPASTRLIGVQKKSYFELEHAVAKNTGYLPPPDTDRSADLDYLKERFDAGEPVSAADRQLLVSEIWRRRSPAAFGATTVPLLVQNGFTDHLFPAEQALRVYRQLAGVEGARVRLQLGDLGHSRGSNHEQLDRRFGADGLAFFDHHLRGGEAKLPPVVTLFKQRCPRTAAPAQPITARNWETVARGQLSFGPGRAQRVSSSGGDLGIAKAFDPVAGGGDACATVRRAGRTSGTAIYQRVSPGFTLAGLTKVSAKVETRGLHGQLAARLWDVSGARQLLVDRGIYRLKPNQRGRIVFELFGNAYDFRRGHVVKLELLGRDPDSFRPSNGGFVVKLRDVVVSLPTREPAPNRRTAAAR